MIEKDHILIIMKDLNTQQEIGLQNQRDMNPQKKMIEKENQIIIQVEKTTMKGAQINIMIEMTDMMINIQIEIENLEESHIIPKKIMLIIKIIEAMVKAKEEVEVELSLDLEAQDHQEDIIEEVVIKTIIKDMMIIMLKILENIQQVVAIINHLLPQEIQKDIKDRKEMEDSTSLNLLHLILMIENTTLTHNIIRVIFRRKWKMKTIKRKEDSNSIMLQMSIEQTLQIE